MMHYFIESNAIPSGVIVGEYNFWLVALSFIVAFIAARIVVYILANIDSQNPESRIRGCVLGSVIMAVGIWSMHFIGMIAYEMKMYHVYDIGLTCLSFVISVIFSCFVFYNITRLELSISRILFFSPILGLGVACMHYIGMLAMQMDGEVRYIPEYFYLSLVIAIVASGAAMWILHTLRTGESKYKEIFNNLVAVIIAVAVCGMHYTGMEASVFIPNANCRFVTDHNELGLIILLAVALTVLFIFGAGIVKKGFLEKNELKNHKNSMFSFYFVAIAILLCGAMITSFVYISTENSEKVSRERFKQNERNKTNEVLDEINKLFQAIHSSARTISKLSSVREIENDGKGFSYNDRIAIQEIYNNLASSIGIGNFYIVSKDFDPNQKDHILSNPILTFSEFIVGRTKEDYINSLGKEEVNEKQLVDNGEYQLIVKQIAALKEKYPTQKSYFSGFDVPAMCGSEVVMREGATSSPTHSDSHHYGFVHTVPFYGMDGQFKGVVCATFPTNTLRGILGSNNIFILNNRDQKIIAPNKVPEFIYESKKYMEKQVVNPNFIYSEVRTIQSKTNFGIMGSKDEKIIGDPNLRYSNIDPYDPHSGEEIFKLWAGTPNDAFYKSEPYQTLSQFRTAAYVLITIMVFLGILSFYYMRRNLESEQNRLVEAFLHAEKLNKSKSEFLANMSHELRTPMHAIMSYTSMGLKKIKDTGDEKLQKFFTNIQISADRLLMLLNDLLDLSKLEAGKMDFNFQRQSFKDVVSNALTELQSLTTKKSLSVNVKNETVASKNPIPIDKLRMTQVVVNLLSNAIKFTPEKSEITISFDIIKNDHEQCLLFTIADQGIGIPEGECEAIFDKFVQSTKTKTGAGGTGLGLSIVKEIVDAHGGDIWAANRASGGAKFSVKLPLDGQVTLES